MIDKSHFLSSFLNRHLVLDTCLAAAFVLLNITAWSKNIFISPSGNDANPGLQLNQPLQTLAAGLQRVAAGDTIYLLPGTYRETIKLTQQKGNPEKYIYIYGYASPQGQKPIIDGGAPIPAMDLSNHWIECANAAWIEFGDLQFKNGWTDPVRIINSSYISFKRCAFYGGRKVILATGPGTHHVLVEDCFWDQGGDMLWTIEKDSRGVDAWLSMHHEMMGYYNGSLVDSRGTGGSFVIRNNHIQNAYNGIRFTSQKGFDANVEIYNNTLTNIRDNDFEPEHYAYNMYIYHNWSHNIHKPVSIDAVGGGYIYYYGNRVTMDSSAWAKRICSGFWKVYGGEDSLSFPMYAFNNSFFGYGNAFNAMEANAPYFKHFNNAYYFAGTKGWILDYLTGTNDFDHDICNKPWPNTITTHNLEQHGIIANPAFRDPLAADLRLSGNSPAIDAGKVISFPELAWTQSYKGKAPDIGAYEGEELVDGPPFRFRLPENAKFSYEEKPRIVRHRVDKNKLILYFSTALAPGSISAKTIVLQMEGRNIPISKVRCPRNQYEWVIETGSILQERKLALGFHSLPIGANGQPMTFWASTIPIIKSTL